MRLLKHTPIYEYHLLNARMTEFAGFDMPLWYTKISEEHLAVRNEAGIFDVSHMGRIRVKGSNADDFLEHIFPTRISGQRVGKCLYTLLLDEKGGIIDDLIILKLEERNYLLVVNAINTDRDLNRLNEQTSGFEAQIEDITRSSAMLAIQGPKALQVLQPFSDISLDRITRFTNVFGTVRGTKGTISRTGYTGEDGFEIILYDNGSDNPSKVLSVWNELATQAKPCGLGARDSLRIEAGLPLYGYDIDETTNPFEAGLEWILSEGKAGYIGWEKLSDLANSEPDRIRRGLLLETRIPRRNHEILEVNGEKIGHVTSGTYSPLLKHGIALGYVKSDYAQVGRLVKVSITSAESGDGQTNATIVKPPFYDQNTYGWKRTHRLQ
jgi:aminomethyltransferase